MNFPPEAEFLRETGSESAQVRGLGGINVAVLAFACSQAINTTDIPIVSLLDYGSFNTAFLMKFPNGRRLVARVPFEDVCSPGLIASQVATMAYAANVLNIPTPAVYAWNDEADNHVRAPYMIMEFIEGVRLDVLWRDENMSRALKLVPIARLAVYHAALLRTLPFSQYGSLYFSEDIARGVVLSLKDSRAYVVGPLVRRKQPYIGSVQTMNPSTPGSSIRDIWTGIWREEYATMCTRWAELSSEACIQEENEAVKEAADVRDARWNEVESAAAELFHLIEGVAPDIDGSSCLSHPDIAFRNVIVDRSTLRVMAMLDWDGAAVLPSLLVPDVPLDLYPGSGDSGEGSLYRDVCMFKGDVFRRERDAILHEIQNSGLEDMQGDEIHVEIFRIAIHLCEADRDRMREYYRSFLYKALGCPDAPTCRQQFSGARIVHRLVTGGFIDWCRYRKLIKAGLGRG